MEKKVDDLVSETKTTHSRVHNVFNEFLMLSNTQFIENRVYEDDVTKAADAQAAAQPADDDKEKKEKTKEERQAEIIPKFAAAVQLGLKTLGAKKKRKKKKQGGGGGAGKEKEEKKMTKETKAEHAEKSLG